MTKEIIAECWDEAVIIIAERVQQQESPYVMGNYATALAIIAAALYAERMKLAALPVHPQNVYDPNPLPTITTTAPRNVEQVWIRDGETTSGVESPR